MEFCRRRLVNLPIFQVVITLIGWIPSGIFLPLVTCWVGGNNNAVAIWSQFLISVMVTAVFTTAQTFFIMEAHLIANLYPDFFHDARPTEVRRRPADFAFYTRLQRSVARGGDHAARRGGRDRHQHLRAAAGL